MKYYYKSLNNKAVWCLKQPNQPENSVEITEEEWTQCIHQKQKHPKEPQN